MFAMKASVRGEKRKFDATTPAAAAPRSNIGVVATGSVVDLTPGPPPGINRNASAPIPIRRSRRSVSADRSPTLRGFNLRELSPLEMSVATAPRQLTIRGRCGSEGDLTISVAAAQSQATVKHSQQQCVRRGALKGFRAAASSMLGKRPTNEDAHTLQLQCKELSADGQLGWCGLYDGHGGCAVSRAVAQTLHSCVGRQLLKGLKAAKGTSTRSPGGAEPRTPPIPKLPSSLADLSRHKQLVTTALVRGFCDADAELLRDKERGSSACGTTALGVVVSGSHIAVAHAGDSRAVLCRGGKAVAVTMDHCVRKNEAEMARVLKASGDVDEEGRVRGLAVSRALGNHDLRRASDESLASSARYSSADKVLIPHPDVWISEWQEDDEFLLLACDGVWDVLDNSTAVAFVRLKLQQRCLAGSAAGGALSGYRRGRGRPRSMPVAASRPAARGLRGGGLTLGIGSGSGGSRGKETRPSPIPESPESPSSSRGSATPAALPDTPGSGPSPAGSKTPLGGKHAFSSITLPDLTAVAEELVQHCFNLGSEDNLTAVILLK